MASRETEGWRVAATYEGERPGTHAKTVDDLRFIHWGKSPSAGSKCEWYPSGPPVFAKPIRFPEGLEMRMTIRHTRIVAKTSVKPDQRGAKVIHWEFLKENPDDSGLDCVVGPVPGPSPGPAFKKLLTSVLGYSGVTIDKKMSVRKLLGFHDVLVLAHLDRAASKGQELPGEGWIPAATFLLDNCSQSDTGFRLKPLDVNRLKFVDGEMNRALRHLVPQDENSAPLHVVHNDARRDHLVHSSLMMGYRQQGLQERDLNIPRAAPAAATEHVGGLGIKIPAPLAERQLQDYLRLTAPQAPLATPPPWLHAFYAPPQTPAHGVQQTPWRAEAARAVAATSQSRPLQTPVTGPSGGGSPTEGVQQAHGLGPWWTPRRSRGPLQSVVGVQLDYNAALEIALEEARQAKRQAEERQRKAEEGLQEAMAKNRQLQNHNRVLRYGPQMDCDLLFCLFPYLQQPLQLLRGHTRK